MKEYLIFSIYLFLIKNKETTASEIARAMEISSRSVYRYIDALSLIGVPVTTKIGKGGGIYLIGEPKLEGLTLSAQDKSILKAHIYEHPNNIEVNNILNKLIF